MKVLVVGTGAGGNKSVIKLIEEGIIDRQDAVLINSTIKDVPAEYRDSAIQLGGVNGCGKERSVGKDITLDAISSGSLNLDSLVNPDHEKVIIVTTLEGGTGSGSSVVLAKYFKDVIGINTEIIGFTGFEEDGRGLQNSIEFFQDLDEEYTVQIIRNSSFLKAANGNKLKAEAAANNELAKRIKVQLGTLIYDSVQNIDSTDLYKVNNTTGYTTVEYKEIEERIKSTDQFNAFIKEMLDETKSLEVTNPSMSRLAVIMNLNTSSQDFIDFKFPTIKERLGVPYESFNHIEYVEDIPEFIAIIAAGQKMPVDEVKAIYKRYEEESSFVNKERDGFFSEIRGLKGNVEDDMFNMIHGKKKNSAKAKEDFLSSFQKKDNIIETNSGNNKSNKQINDVSEY